MKCAQAQKLIKPFLDHSLPDHELAQFLDHVRTCPDCYDELGIYLAIDQTIRNEDATDDPDDFDFRGRLKKEIRDSENILRVHRSQAWIKRGLVAAAVLILGLLIYTGITQKTDPDLPAWETEQEPQEAVTEESISEAAGESVSESVTDVMADTEITTEESLTEAETQEDISEAGSEQEMSESVAEAR